MEQPKVAMLSSDNKFKLGELGMALEAAGTRIITFGKTAGVLRAAGVQLQETGVLEGLISSSMFLSDEHSRSGIARLLMPRIVHAREDLVNTGLSPIDLLYVNLVPPTYNEVLARVVPDAIGVNYILQGMAAGRVVVTEPSSLGAVTEQLGREEGFSTDLLAKLTFEAAGHVERHMHQFQALQPVTI